MEDKLIEYSDKIIEALESGVKFAGEQTPLLIQEVLQYYFIINMMWAVLLLVFVFVLVYFAGKSKDEDLHLLVFILGSIGTGFSLYFWVIVIKITIAPRLFLIEKLTELF